MLTPRIWRQILCALYFFSSCRRRYTRWPRDWSSDVCSSDLTPMRASDFIGGYTLPLIPMAIVQAAVCYGVAIALGLNFTVHVILAILTILPVAIFFIGIGLLCGSLLNEKAVAGICGALLTNITAWFSGAWFSLEMVGGWFEIIGHVLPFVHAVDMGKAVMQGTYADILPHFWWVAGYSIVVAILAVYVFQKNMKSS